MKKIILLTLILVSGLLLTVACSGGGHSGYGKDNELIYELKVNKDGGIDAKSFSGITVSADKDTFANNNITVYLTEEKSTTGVNSLFKVASKCYTLRASTGDGVKVIEVFKPLKLSIQHNATANSDIFVGTKTIDDWNYNCVSSDLVTNLRASKSSEIEYNLYKLPSTIAIFAHDIFKKLDVPVIMGINDDKVVIPSKSGRLTDGEMVVSVSGINLGKTAAKDIQVNLSYESGNKDSKITIIGAGSASTVSSAEQGSGDSYVHTVAINDISKFEVIDTDITLKFTLRLKNPEDLWAPDRFNIEVRNSSKSENFKTLPFAVSTTKMLHGDIPAPTDVIARYNEDTKTVSASWKWSGTDENVEYKVMVINQNGEKSGTYVLGNIKTTEWESNKLGLEKGKYAIKVLAVTSKGTSLESEQTDKSVFIVNNSGPTPTPDIPTPKNVLAVYDEDTKTVSASWEWSGTDKTVKYKVRVISLSAENTYNFYFDNIESKEWSNSKLGLEKGKYAIKVSAVISKDESLESKQTDNSVFIVNTSGPTPTPDIPTPKNVLAKYDENTKTVSASWEWSGTDMDVEYMVKVINLSAENADTYVLGNIESKNWSNSKLGLEKGKYAIKVLAVTSKRMSLESEQTDKSVFIVNTSGPTPTPDIPTPKNVLAKYDENTKTVSASWEWSGTDMDVEYMVKVINLSVEKADTYVLGNIKNTEWETSKLGLENGKYAIKVLAVTSKGMSAESEQTDKSVFVVNNSSPTIPSPKNVLAKYDENTKTVSASWEWYGTDKDVEYMVKVINLDVEKADTYVLGNIKNTEWETSKLGLENGKYAIKVLAVTSQGKSQESEQTDKSVFVVNNSSPSIPSPKNVMAKYDENTKIVFLTWDWEGTDKDVEYSVRIINSDNPAAGNYNFLGIKTTSWNSGESILALPAGDYDVLVSAITASGTSKVSDSTENSNFKVTSPIWIDTLTAPVVKIESSEYDYNSDVTITWSPSRILSVKGTTGSIKYTVYADLGKRPVTVIATETSELQCVIHNTLAGTYLVKVIASANDLTSTSEIVSFNVKQPNISKPVITSSQYMALNGEMYIKWQPVENALSYNIYIYPSNLERKDTPQGSINVAFDDTTSYSAKDDIKEKGIYNIIVEAVNKNAKIFSDVQTIRVDYAPSLARNLSFEISEGRPVVAKWDEDYWKAPDVSYGINVYKNNELIIKESTNKLSWVCSHYLEPGLYSFDVSAENIFGSPGISYNEIEIPVFRYPTDVKMLDAYTGNKQSIVWKAGNDAPDVTYSYRLLKDNKVIISSSSTELVCDTDQYLEAGTYKFEISAKNDWGQSATATYDLKVLENNLKIKASPTNKSDIADIVFDYTMTQEVKDFIVANIGVASETIANGGFRELKTSWLASQTLALHNPYGLKIGKYPVCLKDEKVESLKTNYKISFLKASDNQCVELINDGSEDHPYLVYDAESLDLIRDCTTITDQYNITHFKQTAHIDLSGYINKHYNGSWEPIGQSDYHGRISLGYDGDGYSITGLKIDREGYWTGIFGYLGPNSYIKNLKVAGADVKGRNYVGSIVGYLDHCGIENCCVINSKVIGEYWVGGMVGESHNYSDLVKNCYVTGSTVKGIRHIGGLNGLAFSGKVLNCYVANTTVGFIREDSDNGRIGILVGYPDFNSRIYNSFAAGDYKILNADNTASSSMHICGGLGPICCYGLDKGYVASPTGELVWNTGWPDDTQSTTFKPEDGSWWDSRFPWENCATSPWIIPTGTNPCLPKLSTIKDN